MEVLYTFAVIIVTTILLLLTYFKWAFSYWKRRKVPYVEPKIPFGTSENPFVRNEFIGFRLKKRYDEFKLQGYKHGGLYMFTTPTYVPIDPELIKNIMARDFKYFTDRGTYSNEKNDPLSAHLFNLEGQKWKTLRTKLTPTFSSGKMKLMFPTLLDCGNKLKTAMYEFCAQKTAIEAKEVLGCFTTDVIGSCAFGLDCNSFTNPNNEFRKYGKDIFTSLTKARSVGAVITLASPELGKLLGIALTPSNITEFFMKLVKDTVAYREKNQIFRKDFMQILMDLRNNEIEERCTIEEMAAQAYAFFLAGFETSSTTMSFCLFELARNLDIQERVREEIFQVVEKHDGHISYEAVSDLKYLNQVIDETLRKYSPAPLIPRVCVEDYPISGTDVTIEKGTRILIPVFALHHDPEFYPNPDEFDPDRFTEENKKQRHQFTYLPFGEGPRICIGMRFGLMQTKVGLMMLLMKFRFKINCRTKIPLEIDSTNLVLTAKNGIWLDIDEYKK